MSRALSVVAFAALCVFLTTGCGGGTFALQPVAQAADKTESAGSAKVTLTITLTGKGQTITLPGSGVANMQNGDADITIDLSKLAAQAGGQMNGTDMTEITKDGLVYLKVPFKGMPTDKQWLEVNPKEAAKAAGLPFAQQTGQSPGQAIGILKNATNDQKLGTEQIDGVETTHYRTTVDVAKLLASGSGNVRPWMQGALKEAPKSESFDVWIDSKSLIRRLAFNAGMSSGSVSLTMDLSDYGTPIDVQAPPADQTVDLLKLLKQMSGSTS